MKIFVSRSYYPARRALLLTSIFGSTLRFSVAAEAQTTPLPPAGGQLNNTQQVNRPGRLQAIMSTLAGVDSEAKVDAIMELAQMNLSPQQAVAILRHLLKDKEAWVRITAIKGLTSYSEYASKVLPELLDIARTDDSSSVRAAALPALATITPQSQEVLDLVVESLESDEQETQMASIKALQSFDSKIAVAAIPILLKVAAMDIVSSGPALELAGCITLDRAPLNFPTALRIIQLREKQYPNDVAAALEFIRRKGGSPKEVIPLLIKVIANPTSGAERYLAVRAMEKIHFQGNPEAVTALLSLVEEPSSNNPVSSAAGKVLLNAANLKDAGMVLPLRHALSLPKRSHRLIAAMVLARIGITARTAIPELTTALQQEFRTKEPNYSNIDGYSSVFQMLRPVPAKTILAIHDLYTDPTQASDPDKRAVLEQTLISLTAIAVIPEDAHFRKSILSLAVSRLNEHNLEEAAIAATVVAKFGSAAKPAVPKMTRILQACIDSEAKLSQNRNRLGSTEHEHKGDISATDVCRVIIKALGKLGSNADSATPVLTTYAKLKPGSPLSLLREDALASLGSISPSLAKTIRHEANMVVVQEVVPDTTFVDVNGKKVILSKDQASPILLFFVDTKCPCVRAYTKRADLLQQKFAPNGLRTYYIFPTPREDEAAIKSFQAEVRPQASLVRDRNGKLTRLFNATRTMEAVLLDSKGVLRYQGRIDDNTYEPSKVSKKDLENALTQVTQGKQFALRGPLPKSCILDSGE